MGFSDVSFLYAFFPLVVIGYYLWNNLRYRNLLLLVFSLVFYSWGEPRYIVAMILAAFVAYIGGLLMSHYEEHAVARRFVFVATTVLLILNLLIFKYLNFICDNLESVFDINLPVPELILPIGISFYTFQILSYVIDLYRREISTQKNFLYLLLYVSFFPQLIAGPIVRYQTIEKEIHNRQVTLDDVSYGLKRFIYGLSKKLIIANNVALVTETIYNGDPAVYGTLFYWIAALAYALQIYFDFSGYSDMAIGLGRMFGFHFLENFNYPYISKSITEFWRRWHISLSTWFRDYVYIPLGGNRVSKRRWLFNIFVVWTLTGFWHGAQWNFMFWGLYYCVLLLLEKLFLAKYLEKLPGFLRWIYAMILVCVGWVIFNLTDFQQMGLALKTMFLFQPTDMLGVLTKDSNIYYGLIYIPLGILFSFPLFKKKEERGTVGLLIENIVAMLLLFVCIVYLVSSSYNPFIYFRF